MFFPKRRDVNVRAELKIAIVLIAYWIKSHEKRKKEREKKEIFDFETFQNLFSLFTYP